MTTRPNIVLAVIAGVVVILAVAVAIIAGNRSNPEFDSSTPSGVVKLFVAALHDDNFAEAESYLAPDLGCTAASLTTSAPQGPVQLRVLKESIQGETASVRVEITEGETGPLFGSGWTHEETFALTADGDSWLIAAPAWPFYYCDEVKG